MHLRHEVRDIVRNDDGSWNVVVADLANGGQETRVNAKFVFIGAGGGALKLLQKSGIPEAEGYAGFPVGGGDLLIRRTAFHHDRHPLADLLVVLGDLHAAEQRAVLQGLDALVQEGDVLVTPDEAHVRHVVDEGLRVAQHALLDLVGPELLGDLELLVDR